MNTFTQNHVVFTTSVLSLFFNVNKLNAVPKWRCPQSTRWFQTSQRIRLLMVQAICDNALGNAEYVFNSLHCRKRADSPRHPLTPNLATEVASCVRLAEFPCSFQSVDDLNLFRVNLAAQGKPGLFLHPPHNILKCVLKPGFLLVHFFGFDG